MAANAQKLKYDTSKAISCVDNVETYNEIGQKEIELEGKALNGYKTRGAQNVQEKTENVAIEIHPKEPPAKKKIVIPKVLFWPKAIFSWFLK